MNLQKAGAIGAIAAAFIGVLTLILTGFGAFFVDETELREALDATETELKAAEERITATVERTAERIETQMKEMRARAEAQMEELRGYMIDHFEGHPADDQ